ncbi:MAG: hypothetical protein WC095_00755 [Candidatus Paceibacterota bacterium]
MKSIKSASAYFFIFAVAVLSLISIMGVWDVFGEDVIWKSFKTLGLLAIVSMIIIAAGDHIINSYKNSSDIEEKPSPVWTEIRKVTVFLLIVSVSILALLGVLSIWEVIKDKDVQYKTLSSLVIISFGALIVIVTCKNMEGINKKTTPITINLTKEEINKF